MPNFNFVYNMHVCVIEASLASLLVIIIVNLKSLYNMNVVPQEHIMSIHERRLIVCMQVNDILLPNVLASVLSNDSILQITFYDT